MIMTVLDVLLSCYEETENNLHSGIEGVFTEEDENEEICEWFELLGEEGE